MSNEWIMLKFYDLLEIQLGYSKTHVILYSDNLFDTKGIWSLFIILEVFVHSNAKRYFILMLCQPSPSRYDILNFTVVLVLFIRRSQKLYAQFLLYFKWEFLTRTLQMEFAQNLHAYFLHYLHWTILGRSYCPFISLRKLLSK